MSYVCYFLFSRLFIVFIYFIFIFPTAPVALPNAEQTEIDTIKAQHAADELQVVRREKKRQPASKLSEEPETVRGTARHTLLTDEHFNAESL